MVKLSRNEKIFFRVWAIVSVGFMVAGAVGLISLYVNWDIPTFFVAFFIGGVFSTIGNICLYIEFTGW